MVQLSRWRDFALVQCPYEGRMCVSVLEITKSVPDRVASLSGASFVSCASVYCPSCFNPSGLVTKGVLCCAFSQCHVVILAFVNCSSPCMCRKSSPRPPQRLIMNGSAGTLRSRREAAFVIQCKCLRRSAFSLARLSPRVHTRDKGGVCV